MEDKRVIKKYPNRRLYDTVESRYITLEEIRQLVLKGVDFCVLDQKSGDDITRSILLQVIIEQECEGEPLFTTDVLQRIIRFYGDTLQGVASEYLERSLSLFTEQQQMFQDRLREAVTSNPLTAMTELAQKNLDLWKKMQDSFFLAASHGHADDGGITPAKRKAKKSEIKE
jgi:polyhydroxyalkanoate synthesis repressor PhaR